MTRGCEILLTPNALEPPPPEFSSAAGAVVDFYGVVRGHEQGERISGIDYEAFDEMARHQLDLLCQEAMQRFNLLGLILHHRTGYIPAAVPSLFLRATAAHRGPAFEASQWLIAQLKLRVPIWKRPLAESTGNEVYPPTPGVAPASYLASTAEHSPGSNPSPSI